MYIKGLNMTTPPTVARLLLLGAVLTGSRVFNCAKPDSDWDLIVYADMVPDWIYDHPTYDTCPKIDTTSTEGSKPPNQGYDYKTFGNSLEDISRFIDDDGTNINLIIFNRSLDILPKFKELNKKC